MEHSRRTSDRGAPVPRLPAPGEPGLLRRLHRFSRRLCVLRMWLFFAFSGPVLWAISIHLDKYLVTRYFAQSSVAVLLVFTALVGLLLLPPIWLFRPDVVHLPPSSMALIGF